MGQSYSSERLGLQQRVWQHECERARAGGKFRHRETDGRILCGPLRDLSCTAGARTVKLLPNGSYFLTRYDDLVSAYKNTKLFSSDKKKEFLPKYGDSLLYEHHTTSLVFNDPPAHTRVRRLIMGALSPRATAEMGPDLI